MFKAILMKLRDKLDALPDDRVSLSEELYRIESHVGNIRDDSRPDQTGFNVRCIYEAAERLRRAEIDGKLMFDIQTPKETEKVAIPNTDDPSKSVTNHVNHRHDAFSCTDRSLIEDAKRSSKGGA